jgi:RES domain-containing protein
VGRQRKTRDKVLASTPGRFHDDPATEPTSYLADSLLTAWREVTAVFGGIPGDPKAFRAWRVTVAGARLADLRDPEEQARQQVTEAELLADPPPPRCMEVARKLRQPKAGYHGMIYQSVRNQPDGVCAVLFLDRAEGLIALEPLGDEEWEEFVRQAAM